MRVRMSRDRDARIAELMVQGNTRGMIKSIHTLRTIPFTDEKVTALSRHLLETEQRNIEEMKRFL